MDSNDRTLWDGWSGIKQWEFLHWDEKKVISDPNIQRSHGNFFKKKLAKLRCPNCYQYVMIISIRDAAVCKTSLELIRFWDFHIAYSITSKKVKLKHNHIKISDGNSIRSNIITMFSWEQAEPDFDLGLAPWSLYQKHIVHNSVPCHLYGLNVLTITGPIFWILDMLSQISVDSEVN